MLTLTNRIDMRPGAVPLVIHLGQYDSDFSLVFELYSSAGNFTVESGTTAMIRGTKTDGHAYDADATIDVSAKTVTVAGSEQMTAAKGRNVYELVLTKSGKVLSTANFILDVERAAMDADTIASESVLKELNAIIAGAETATEAAADAASAADRAEDAAESVSSASAQIATNTADISDLKADFEQFVPGLTDEAKAALLACFEHVAWLDGQEDYYETLKKALDGESTAEFPIGDFTSLNYGNGYYNYSVGYAFYNTNHNMLTANLSQQTFYPGDVLKLSAEAKNTYYFRVGTGYNLASPANRGFIQDAYTSEDLILTSADIADAKVIRIERQDEQDLTDDEITYLGNNVLYVKSGQDISDQTAFVFPDFMNKITGGVDPDSLHACGIKLTTELTNRRNFHFPYGKRPYFNKEANKLMPAYPIPVPNWAKSAHIEITPNSQYIYIWQFRWDENAGIYRAINSSSWQVGSYDYVLDNTYSDRALTVNAKYDSAGSSYPTEPTVLHVEFSR